MVAISLEDDPKRLAKSLAGYPVAPEDGHPDHGPCLVSVDIPGDTTGADLVSDAGLRIVGLLESYPVDEADERIGWDRCQPIGAGVAAAGSAGVWCRSAAVAAPSSCEELAWFPGPGERAVPRRTDRFAEWYFGDS